MAEQEKKNFESKNLDFPKSKPGGALASGKSQDKSLLDSFDCDPGCVSFGSKDDPTLVVRNNCSFI